MKTKRRGLAAVETTVAGAALVFLVSTVVPSFEELKKERKCSTPATCNLKQLSIAIINYQNSTMPTIDAIAAAVADDDGIDPREMTALNLELGEHLEQYTQLIASIDRARRNSKCREEVRHLNEMRGDAIIVYNDIETTRRFLDTLAMPELIGQYPDQGELVDIILNPRR